MKKIIGIILGILMCVGGFYCLMFPDITFSSITIIFAITLFESAAGYFFLWRTVKLLGGKSFLLFITAILSIICGVSLLTNVVTQLFVESFVLTLISVYMIIAGVLGVVNAIKFAKLTGARFILSIILGIVLIACGILSLTNPVALALSIGTMMALDIMATGFVLIILSIIL